MRFGTLRNRLLASLLGLSLGPLALVGILAYRSAEQGLREKALNHLSTAAILKAQEISSWVAEKEQDIHLLATLPDIRAAVQRLLADHRTGRQGGGSKDTLRVILHHLPLTHPDFAEIFLLDARTGEVVVSTDPEEEGKLKDDRPYFREGRVRPFVQSIYYSLSLGGPTMTLATPVLDAVGRPAGVLVGRVNLAKLDQVMAERTGLGTTGETFLVNRFNFFVSEVRGGDQLPEQAAVFTEGVRAALRGENGTALYRNHRGIPVVGAYRWLPDVDLALVAEVEQAEAFAPVFGLRRTLLGIGLLLIAAVLPLALWMSRSVTRPVSNLVAGARALGAGDLGHRIPVGGPEELAFLAQAFNRMAEALEEGREELEHANVGLEVKVQERTAELAALHSVAVAISRSLNLAKILEVAADAILPVLRAEGCLIRAVAPESGSRDGRPCRPCGPGGQRGVPCGPSAPAPRGSRPRPLAAPPGAAGHRGPFRGSPGGDAPGDGGRLSVACDGSPTVQGPRGRDAQRLCAGAGPVYRSPRPASGRDGHRARHGHGKGRALPAGAGGCGVPQSGCRARPDARLYAEGGRGSLPDLLRDGPALPGGRQPPLAGGRGGGGAGRRGRPRPQGRGLPGPAGARGSTRLGQRGGGPGGTAPGGS
ncbi:MAG: HAMP domain-containing protein [candidate division NC10 bacterium]|nr:HAMP domain-containing protein [candidate division NC10 bacterium]